MPTISRRSFLVAGGAAGISACASRGTRRDVAPLDIPNETRADAPLFFNAEERRFVSAACARLIPEDELGPGAVQAGVPNFIDRQLAGPYGQARTWYMQGPWRKGSEQQGYQLKFAPAELYRLAIRNLDAYCRRQFHAAFADMSNSDQDAVLTALEKDSIELVDVPGKTFFTMLLQNTTEGFLSDPMYGGNRDFAGWKLIGFPGARYNYVEEIEQYGMSYPLPPVGLLGRRGGRTRKI
ncbi:MAG: gluconate 2-dehydrogenase subunit 3 family protein [Gammaproteobacteria bacterium]|nr:MAG: gluconate 2-dehydrogenase subunit 3 family protein [Gammaproteobacteria bacterium]